MAWLFSSLELLHCPQRGNGAMVQKVGGCVNRTHWGFLLLDICAIHMNIDEVVCKCTWLGHSTSFCNHIMYICHRHEWRKELSYQMIRPGIPIHLVRLYWKCLALTSCGRSSICTSVRTSTAIDNPVTSQQESPFFLWSLGPVPAWGTTRYHSFLPQSRYLHVRLNSDS